MHLVAIISLGTSADAEAPALAKDLGVTAFEAGQKVRGATPAVVLKTADAAEAQALCDKLAARGHRAVTCDLASVPAANLLREVHAFRLEPEALVSVGPGGAEARLDWSALRLVVRATHHAQTQSVEATRARAFSLGRAVASGGLVVTREVKQEARSGADTREPVAYLFHTAGPPWLLKEGRLDYRGLGGALEPARFENFQALLAQVQARAPHALVDARLVNARGLPERLGSDFLGQQTSSTDAGAVDLLAHLLWLALVTK